MPQPINRRHRQARRVAQKPALLSVYSGKRTKRLQSKYVLRRQLTVSLRKFRTAPARRSSKLRQRVYPLRLFGYRELAFALQIKAARRQPQSNIWRSTKRLMLSPATLMVLGVSGTLFFSLNLQHPVVLAPKHVSADTQTVQPTSAVKSLGRSVPTHISIPKIQLDAQILPTGLSSTGSIQVPDNPWATGWFTNSPTPGEVGPSVIVGHVDWINNIAVFWRLRELAPGDTVAITREDGSTAKFTITQIAQYAQDQFPTQAVYGNINYPGLRLITCGGTFDTSTRHYNQNTVVYAVLTS